MGVGLRLKELLRDRGMTIKELAEQANVPANTLYSITRRDSDRVDSVVLARISRALDVSIGTLTGTASVSDILANGPVTVRDIAQQLNMPEESIRKIISRNNDRCETTEEDAVVTVATLLEAEIEESQQRDAAKIFKFFSEQGPSDLITSNLQDLFESRPPEWQYTSLLLLNHFSKLNLQGQRKALTYLRDLSELPRYQAIPQAFPSDSDNHTDERMVISVGIPKTKNHQGRTSVLRDPRSDGPGKTGTDAAMVSTGRVEPEGN